MVDVTVGFFAAPFACWAVGDGRGIAVAAAAVRVSEEERVGYERTFSRKGAE